MFIFLWYGVCKEAVSESNIEVSHIAYRIKVQEERVDPKKTERTVRDK